MGARSERICSYAAHSCVAPGPEPVQSLPALREAFARGDLDDCGRWRDRLAFEDLARALQWNDAAEVAAPEWEERTRECTSEALTATQRLAFAIRVYRRGDAQRAAYYSDQALETASDDAQRADFVYSLAARGHADADSLYRRALDYQPNHGPARFALARLFAAGIGQPRSVDERAAYWCLADRFREVAASGDTRVTTAAEQAAKSYERAGPSREDYSILGWTRSQSVELTSGVVSCSTIVR
jgi:hypothetical protein